MDYSAYSSLLTLGCVWDHILMAVLVNVLLAIVWY